MATKLAPAPDGPAHVPPEAPIALLPLGALQRSVARHAGRAIAGAELVEHVGRVASVFAGGSGRIVVACRNRYHLCVALLAAWSCGRPVALPPSHQSAVIARLMGEDALLLHDDPALKLGGTDLAARLTSSSTAPLRDLSRLHAMPAGQLLVTLYTSGSVHEHRPWTKTAAQLLGEARDLGRLFRLGPGDVVLSTVPGHHIYGLLFSVLIPLLAGSQWGDEVPSGPGQLTVLARELGANVLVSVPAHLTALAARVGEPLKLRYVFSSGAPLADDTREILRRRSQLDCVELLGSTETGGIALRRAGGRWRPLPGVQVEMDPNGCLVVRSPYLAAEDQGFVTADRAELHADGTFQHLGRADQVVKVGAKRLNLAELEARVIALEGVRAARAIAVDTPHLRQQSVLLAVEGSDLDPEQLRTNLGAYFEPTLLPREIRVLEELPRTTTGKVRRQDLLALFGR